VLVLRQGGVLVDADDQGPVVALDKIIRRARAEVRRGEVYSLDEVKREMLTESDSTKKPLRQTRRKAARG